jgi:hypothetical protein
MLAKRNVRANKAYGFVVSKPGNVVQCHSIRRVFVQVRVHAMTVLVPNILFRQKRPD